MKSMKKEEEQVEDGFTHPEDISGCIVFYDPQPGYDPHPTPQLCPGVATTGHPP